MNITKGQWIEIIIENGIFKVINANGVKGYAPQNEKLALLSPKMIDALIRLDRLFSEKHVHIMFENGKDKDTFKDITNNIEEIFISLNID